MKEGMSYKYLNPASILTWYLKEFLPYIFYAQFGYLYSFAPSTFNSDQIKKCVKDSLFRNKAEVQNVYDNLKTGYNTYFTAKTMQFMRYNKETHEISKIADAKQMRCVMEEVRFKVMSNIFDEFTSICFFAFFVCFFSSLFFFFYFFLLLLSLFLSLLLPMITFNTSNYIMKLIYILFLLIHLL